MNRLTSPFSWLLLVGALPAAGCVLVQPLDSAVSDDDSSAAAGSAPSHAGAKGSAGKSSGSAGAPGSAGATGSAGRGASGSGAGGAPTQPSGKARFIGSWIATEGMLTFTCPGVPAQSSDVTGYVQTWSAGTTSDLLQENFEGTCPLKANVSGTIASSLAGQTCIEDSTDTTSGDAITQTFEFTSYKFVIDAAGTTGTESFSGSDVYADKTTGGTLNCTFARLGAYTKQ